MTENLPSDSEMDVFSYIAWLLRVGMNFEFTNPRLAQIGYRAIYGDAPLPTETRQIIEEGSMQFFRQLVQQGVGQGMIDPEIDAAVAAFIFNAVFTNLGDFIMKQQSMKPEDLLGKQGQAFTSPEIEKLFDQVLRILRLGMATK